MASLLAWVEAIRVQTIPLAISSSILGSMLALADQSFKWPVLVLSILTTILLQILSNLANDYGDFKSGADNPDRKGPRRLVQSGLIKTSEMKTGIVITAILALISGSLLIITGVSTGNTILKLVFFLLGIGAIIAAIKYTLGKNPYGYKGLGDLFVFIFFGLVGVIGTYFLHSSVFKAWLLLPAASVGFLSAAVLNLNNLRDYGNDSKTNKKTLVVFFGPEWGKLYHVMLVSLAIISITIFNLFNYKSVFQFLFILTLPFLIRNIVVVYRFTEPEKLYSELKNLAISTFFFSFTFGLGQIL